MGKGISYIKNKIIELLKSISIKNKDNNIIYYDKDSHMYFILSEDEILATTEEIDDLDYYFGRASEEQIKEINELADSLKLDYKDFNIMGYIGRLDEIIEYYEENGDDNEETDSIIDRLKILLDKLNSPESSFKDNIDLFADAYEELRDGVAYIHESWDHDGVYYQGEGYKSGVETPLYDHLIYKCYEVYLDDEEECRFWLEILSNIDSYIFLTNQ